MTTDPKCWPDHLHPEDARRILDECPRLVERGKGTLEYRFRRREGGYIWILDTFRVVYDDAGRPLELVGAWADITDGKHAEQAALEAKRYLARLIESSTDAIISTDKEGKIVLVNDGAERLLGYQAKDLIVQPETVLYGSEAGAKEVLREMRKREGTVSGFDCLVRAKDGSTIPVLISASMLHDEEGREVGTVGFATDMRERKREQEALQQAYDELERRVEERTTELNTARERFQYLLTVTPGIIYTTQASGEYACTFVSENVDPIMGFSPWEMLEDPGLWFSRLHPDDAPRVAAEMAPPHRARRWESRVSVPQQSRKLYLDPRHLQGHPWRGRPAFGACRLLGGYFLPQAGRAGSWRAHGHHEGLADARRSQSVGHLYHHAISGRLCLPVCERELDADHGLSAVGDAR
jgi:PAS domain S-box-containing protein